MPQTFFWDTCGPNHYLQQKWCLQRRIWWRRCHLVNVCLFHCFFFVLLLSSDSHQVIVIHSLSLLFGHNLAFAVVLLWCSCALGTNDLLSWSHTKNTKKRINLRKAVFFFKHLKKIFNNCDNWPQHCSHNWFRPLVLCNEFSDWGCCLIVYIDK